MGRNDGGAWPNELAACYRRTGIRAHRDDAAKKAVRHGQKRKELPWIRVQLSTGQLVEVHPDDREKLLRRDPAAKILQ